MKIKNRLIALLLSIIMLLSLCACGLVDAIYPDCSDLFAESTFNTAALNRDNIVAFEQMEYTRPDVDAIQDKADEVISLLNRFFKLREVIEGLNGYFTLYNNFYTMSSIANIRCDADTEDEFYREEHGFCSEAASAVELCTDELLLACSNYALCDYLDENYFFGYLSEYYSVTDGSGYTPSDELAELERREAELENDYSALYAKYTKDFNDGSYKKHSDEIGKIYIELIKVRNEIAKLYNADSYRALAYENNGRDYTAEELSDYIAAIKSYIAPVYKAADAKGLFDKPLLNKLSAEKAFSTVSDTMRGLDGRIDEALDFMLEYKLYDVGDSENKLDQSYEIYLDDYNAPFLFCKPSGYSDTALSVAHEFGHFVDDYINYGSTYSLDSSEMFSQGMEYLLLCNLGDGKTADTLTRYKMLDALMLYSYQGCLNEFEQRAYAMSDDELSVENLNSLYAKLSKEYGFLDTDSEDFGMDWISVPHLFTSPFYVISYCVSDSAAFELYNMELESKGAGLEMYMKLLDKSAGNAFLELVSTCEMRSPISADTVKSIADTLTAKLKLS